MRSVSDDVRASSAPGPRDTIAALSTATGRAAIAVIRVSGPAAGAVLETLCGGRPEPRRASYRVLRRPADDLLLDRGLCIWFPGPATATGENLAELHIHGGRAVVAAVMEAVLAVDGVRAAEPGEFTRRAFLAGRIDLAQTEGLADLLEADTEAQRRQAVLQSEGALGAVVEGWRGRLVAAMALVEAGIDFAEEDDVPASARAEARMEVAGLADDLRLAVADTRAERLRDGFRVAIVGAPNAGKSSLLNALARREAAIVTDMPGATRDVVEVHLDLGGYPVILADTAGLREATDAAEREGIRRALARARDADLALLVADATSEGGPGEDFGAAQVWRVASKIDLLNGRAAPVAEHAISTRTGDGVEDLLAAIGSAAVDGLGGADQAGLVRARHRAVASSVADTLDEALRRWADLPDEVLAETLRSAATELGRIAGRVGVEDVLDRLFASFCIGK